MSLQINRIIQGDSFEYDFARPKYEPFTDDWKGFWAITHDIEDVPAATGSLVLNEDKTILQFSLHPTICNSLPLMDYWLVIIVENLILDYHKEVVRERFRLVEQGIAGALPLIRSIPGGEFLLPARTEANIGMVPVVQEDLSIAYAMPEVEPEMFMLHPHLTSEANPYIAGSNGETKIGLTNSGYLGPHVTAYILLPSRYADYVDPISGVSAQAIATAIHSDSDMYLDTSGNAPASACACIVMAHSISNMDCHDFAIEGLLPLRPTDYNKGFRLGDKAHNEFEYYPTSNSDSWTVAEGGLTIFAETAEHVDGWGHPAEVNTAGALKRYTLNQEQFTKLDEAASSYVHATYQQLLDLKLETVPGKHLLIGQKYVITDFCAIYKQPLSDVIKIGKYDFDRVKAPVALLTSLPVDDVLGDYRLVIETDSVYILTVDGWEVAGDTYIEPIIVTATSESLFELECKSTLYPNDILYYHFNDDLVTYPDSPKGFISRRIDQSKSLDVAFDFRNIVLRRHKLDLTNIPLFVPGELHTKGQMYVYNTANINILRALVPQDLIDDPTLEQLFNIIGNSALPYIGRRFYIIAEIDGVYDNWLCEPFLDNCQVLLCLEDNSDVNNSDTPFNWVLFYTTYDSGLYTGDNIAISEYAFSSDGMYIPSSYMTPNTLTADMSTYREYPAFNITNSNNAIIKLGIYVIPDIVIRGSIRRSDIRVDLRCNIRQDITDCSINGMGNVMTGGSLSELTITDGLIYSILTQGFDSQCKFNNFRTTLAFGLLSKVFIGELRDSMLQGYFANNTMVDVQGVVFGESCDYNEVREIKNTTVGNDFQYNSSTAVIDGAEIGNNVKHNKFNGPTISALIDDNVQYSQFNSAVDTTIYADSSAIVELGTGNRQTLTASNTTIFGAGNRYQGNFNLVLGSNNNITGDNQVVIGSENVLVGLNDVLMGSYCALEGFKNFLVGGASFKGVRRGVLGSILLSWGLGPIKSLLTYVDLPPLTYADFSARFNGLLNLYLVDHIENFRVNDYIGFVSEGFANTIYSRVLDLTWDRLILDIEAIPSLLPGYEDSLISLIVVPMPVAVYETLEDLNNLTATPVRWIDPLTYKWNDEYTKQAKQVQFTDSFYEAIVPVANCSDLTIVVQSSNYYMVTVAIVEGFNIGDSIKILCRSVCDFHLKLLNQLPVGNDILRWNTTNPAEAVFSSSTLTDNTVIELVYCGSGTWLSVLPINAVITSISGGSP